MPAYCICRFISFLATRRQVRKCRKSYLKREWIENTQFKYLNYILNS